MRGKSSRSSRPLDMGRSLPQGPGVRWSIDQWLGFFGKLLTGKHRFFHSIFWAVPNCPWNILKSMELNFIHWYFQKICMITMDIGTLCNVFSWPGHNLSDVDILRWFRSIQISSVPSFFQTTKHAKWWLPCRESLHKLSMSTRTSDQLWLVHSARESPHLTKSA